MNSLLLIAVLCVAVVTDTRSNRIPNWLTGPALLAGLALSVLSPFESLGLTESLLGTLVGALVLLPGYVMGKMGAGDVKLMAVCGSFLGTSGVINAGLLTMVSGGILALLWLFMFKTFAVEMVAPQTNSVDKQVPVNESVWGKRFPYALAIATGNLLVLFTGFNVFDL